MKKLGMLILGAIILILTYTVPNVIGNIDNKNINVSFYTTGKSNSNAINLYGDTYMTNGNGKNYKEIKKSLTNIKGITAQFRGNYDDFNKTIKKCGMEILDSEEINGILIMRGYSDKCGKPVYVNGKAINMQIAINKDLITVGTPLIMGSY